MERLCGAAREARSWPEKRSPWSAAAARTRRAILPDKFRLSDRFDQRSCRVSNHMETLLRSLRKTSDQLSKLLERLQNRPSDLIFSDPPPADEV